MKRLLSPMNDPFWRNETTSYESECVEEGNLHLAELSEYVNDCSIQTTIISKKIFTWNPMDSLSNQQHFYQQWFHNKIHKLGVTNTDIPCQWNAFLFQFVDVCQVDKFILIQQWLDNRNRMQIWQNYGGQFYQFDCFVDMLHCIGSKYSWVVFIHFKLDFQVINLLKTITFGTFHTIMNDSDLILCINCTPRNYTKYQPQKYMEMNFILNKQLQLSKYHQACVGTIIKWCNNIIPKCVDWINTYFFLNLSCKFPFKCHDKKETVRDLNTFYDFLDNNICCVFYAFAR